MKYGSWTFGQFEALLNRLGEENARQMLDCREVVVEFNKPEKRATVTADDPSLKVWKTIKIGTAIKNGAFCSELEKKDFRIGDWARDMLGQKVFNVDVATQEEDVDLVRLSVANLGFKEGARYDAICARATEMGLELCPAEVGPQLRLQYKDQPRGEWILVAMEPITDSNGRLRIFHVEHDGSGLWLHGRYGRPDGFWDPDSLWVFLRRKVVLGT